jgi:curved DNA-binding protein CbpA
MDFKQDYYAILGLTKTASKEEIRAAYRRLAKLHHPDHNFGNPEAGEKFKLINEAHEVLSNDILRHEYDVYRKQEEEWRAKQESTAGPEASSSNKRNYLRKKTVTTETRIYIRGEVQIKYWADPEDEDFGTFQDVVKYKITPYEARVTITESDIHPLKGIPLDYMKAFKESELFKSRIPQPVNCTVKTPSGDEDYQLELQDIRIKNIKLDYITKYENLSLGTLFGDIYAYSPKFDTHEEEEEVTECFGATGRVERKTEEGKNYYRKEYYHPDCTTYWSAWYTAPKPAGATYNAAAVNSASAKAPQITPITEGCAQLWWIPLLLLFIVLFPKFIIGLLILFAIGLLFSLGSVVVSLFRGIAGILAIAVLFLFLITAIRSFSGTGKSFVKHDTPSYDSLSTTQHTVKRKKAATDSSTQNSEDTLITHFIRWADYGHANYETTLSISVHDVRSSTIDHNTMDPFFTTNSLAPVYSEMLQKDVTKMNYIYSAFDSIKRANSMDELSFARMMVSCVQSIPYFLVVDRSCTDQYDDEFTRNYLATCNRDCCIGNEKYGVRSPAEFIGDLKGDCDTRALFLYGLLKHFNYNVALVTSQYYQHAMIAVNFPNDNVDGLAMNIHNKNYYMWETTSAGLDAGRIPTYVQNLDYWDIALLNENN